MSEHQWHTGTMLIPCGQSRQGEWTRTTSGTAWHAMWWPAPTETRSTSGLGSLDGDHDTGAGLPTICASGAGESGEPEGDRLEFGRAVMATQIDMLAETPASRATDPVSSAAAGRAAYATE
ncbi:hypothetical protein [Arhodomonas sp. AD133]|uniref:hypothetical protein n=1 Tax=Arhodomonas sp. AD133 TaxID=3415009 RepID=UPI003EBE60B2